MTSENFRLDREIDAARLLRTGLADLIADDPQLGIDMVEGETNLNEALQAAASQYCADKCLLEAVKAQIDLLDARAARIAKRMELTRHLVTVALEQSGRQNMETTFGMISLKRIPPSLIVSKEREAEIPPEFWKRGDPVLDKAKLKAALKEGRAISGATLSNGDITVAFSFK